MMDAVVKQEDGKGTSFFGKKPELKDLKSLGKASVKIEKGRPGKIVLQVAILLLILTGGFFYTQNSANFTLFGSNPAQKAALAESEVSELRGEVNVEHYLSAVLLLDQYAGQADEYFYNVQQAESAYTSANKAADYESAAAEQREDMLALLADVQGHLPSLTGDDLIAAKAVVDELVTALQGKSGEVDEQTLLQEIQDFETAKTLMQSPAVQQSITGLNLDEVADEDLAAVAEDFSQINSSVTALISEIKAERTNWSFYVEAIEDLTKEVDPLFNTEFQGNLELSSVAFGPTGVTVTGKTLTEDTKNFTLVSNLMDVYEASDHFMNVEERSYSKSGNAENAYSGSFRISMSLETQDQ